MPTSGDGSAVRREQDYRHVIIHEVDCGTVDGIEARAIVESGEIIEPLRAASSAG